MPIAPAPFRPVAYCVEATITAYYIPTGTKMINRLSFGTANAEPDGADTFNVAGMVNTWIVNHYAPIVCTFIEFLSVVVKSRAAEFGPYSAIAVGTSGLVAVNNTAGMDPAWAPLVLLNCGLTGRVHHGRVYMFTPSNADMPTNGTFGDTILNGWTDALDNLRTTSGALNLPLVIASPTTNTFKPVTDVQHSTRMTLQTRRRQGFGEF